MSSPQSPASLAPVLSLPLPVSALMAQHPASPTVVTTSPPPGPNPQGLPTCIQPLRPRVLGTLASPMSSVSVTAPSDTTMATPTTASTSGEPSSVLFATPRVPTAPSASSPSGAVPPLSALTLSATTHVPVSLAPAPFSATCYGCRATHPSPSCVVTNRRAPRTSPRIRTRPDSGAAPLGPDAARHGPHVCRPRCATHHAIHLAAHPGLSRCLHLSEPFPRRPHGPRSWSPRRRSRRLRDPP